MRRLPIVTLVLLLGTSCPRKSVVLRVEPAAAPVGGEDSRATILGLLDRITHRHAFIPSVSLQESAPCTQTWRRRIRDKGPRQDAFVCADYTASGPIVVRVADIALSNQAWTPPTDSLRRELIDSLGQAGHLVISDR